jgi:hypothetical protein
MIWIWFVLKDSRAGGVGLNTMVLKSGGTFKRWDLERRHQGGNYPCGGFNAGLKEWARSYRSRFIPMKAGCYRRVSLAPPCSLMLHLSPTI